MFFLYMICTRQYSVMVFPMAFTSLKKSFKMDNGVKYHIKYRECRSSAQKILHILLQLECYSKLFIPSRICFLGGLSLFVSLSFSIFYKVKSSMEHTGFLAALGLKSTTLIPATQPNSLSLSKSFCPSIVVVH